jgi:hypothetical protein
VAQLKKIERHRKWLQDPPKARPLRSDFQLPENQALSNRLEGILAKRLETFNLHRFSLPDDERAQLKEAVFDLCNSLTHDKFLDWDNWPAAMRSAGLTELAQLNQLSDEMVDLLHREAHWRKALDQWQKYQQWLAGRNQERAVLEAKFTFDTKHAMHLVRLARTGVELLRTGELAVKRKDAAELLAIRQGAWTYEQVVAYAQDLDQQMREAQKTSPLPDQVDYEKIDQLYLELINDYGH